MTKEMMRPCTLWGHTFDACDFNMDYFEVFRNESDCNYNVYFLGTKIATVDEYADSFPIYRQIITTIADALNAPVLASKKVLAGLPTDAKALLIEKDGTVSMLKTGFLPIIEYGWVWHDSCYVQPYHRIQAHNDPKTAEYLRQFTLEGKRIKQKEMN